MKKLYLLPIVVLPVLLSSCATPPPPQAYHGTDNQALVIDSLDAQTSRIIQPVASVKTKNDQVLTTAEKFPDHKTAVVILENYSELQAGNQFRDRGTPWFVGLRNLGYEHIYFLQGKGIADPDGLLTLVKYD